MSEKSNTTPHPHGRAETLPPLDYKEHNGLIVGWNATNSRAAAAAEREQGAPDKTEGLGKKILTRVGVITVAGLVALGLVNGNNGGESTPSLDTTYTATGTENAADIARNVMGNDEWRNLSDKLAADSAKDGHPGYQPGEQVHVPHQYVEHLEEQQKQQQGQ